MPESIFESRRDKPDSKKLPEPLLELAIVTDDGTKNWQASIAVKITAVVMWVIIPFGFVIALLLVNNIQHDINTSINDDAEILLNSARVLFSEDNSYNSPRTIKELKRNLKKSVYCKINFDTENLPPIVILTKECQQQTHVIDKKYFFTTLFNDQPQELALILSHRPVVNIMMKYRSNVIVSMIIIVIVLGLVLIWVIRLLVLKHLLEMVEATRLISEGKHDLRLNLNQHDEFGYLAKFLNKTLDQIFEQQKNLKQANQELMKEVAERSRIALELRANRDQLEKLVDKRTEDLAIARDEALEANKAKSLCLANMSHEIQTPLNAILRYSQLLHRENDFTEQQLKSLKIIEESGNNLSGLLNDILDITRIETGKMKLKAVKFDLNELLHGISQVFQERCSDNSLNWREQNELPDNVFVYSDPQKLRQILFNLLGHAVNFTDQGEISLRVKLTGHDQYLFEISDTGSGIVPEEFKDIHTAFHPEQTDTAKDGTALGIAITKKHLELLGSKLKVSSIVGEGSVFSFSLQLKPAHSGLEIRQKSRREIIRPAPTDSIKALVVDDSELSRNLLVDMLTEIDAVVISVNNGLEAIEFIQEAAPEDRPDIVFMGIRMPVMNGIETVKRIRDTYDNSIICVAVTGSDSGNPDEKYFQAGFNDFISKPYRFEAVFQCMKKHLHIDFEHESILQIDDQKKIEIDFKQCNVPAALYKDLLKASKSYALSNLKISLAELALCGEKEEKAAQQLTRLMEEYDMQGMVTLIEKFAHNDD